MLRHGGICKWRCVAGRIWEIRSVYVSLPLDRDHKGFHQSPVHLMPRKGASPKEQLEEPFQDVSLSNSGSENLGEKLYKTAFGTIRLDSNNKIERHGQFDHEENDNLSSPSSKLEQQSGTIEVLNSFFEMKQDLSQRNVKPVDYGDSGFFLETSPRECDKILSHFHKTTKAIETRVSSKKNAAEKPRVKNKNKIQIESVKKRYTALDFVKQMKKLDESLKSSQDESVSVQKTKEEEVARLGQSLQSRMSEAVKAINASKMTRSLYSISNVSAASQKEEEDVDELDIINDDGRVREKFLPPVLNKMTSMEVEKLLSESIIMDRCKLAFLDIYG